MNKFFILFLILFIATTTFADYMSKDLKQAIEIECEKSVKNNEYLDEEECNNSITEALNAQGVISVKKITSKKRQQYIERVCIFEKKIGALDYNRCIYEEVYKELGIEIIDPPVLVVSVPVENGDDSTQEPKIEKDPVEEPGTDDEIVVTTKVIVQEMPESLERLISQKAIPSAYFIQTYINNPDPNDEKKIIPDGTGTGISIDTNLIATACHVVTDITWDQVNEKLNYEYKIVNLIHVNDNVLDKEKWFRKAKLYSEDFSTDRCILKVDNLNAQSATTRNYEDLEEFEQIYAVGNPRGFIGQTKGGKITRLYNFVPPVSWLQKIFASSNIELIETDAPIDKGNSGGGLFDVNANLIGIVSMCEILGGPVECYNEKGVDTSANPGPNDKCYTYCNRNQAQNWSIPISRFDELLK